MFPPPRSEQADNRTRGFFFPLKLNDNLSRVRGCLKLFVSRLFCQEVIQAN